MSSIQELNKDSNEFSLSTWTRSISKSSRLSYYIHVQILCYEEPKKEITSYASEQLVCNLKTYNGIKL